MKIKEFLFNHSSAKQVIFKNTVWLTVAEGVTRISKLALTIYVARVLGAQGYGEFNFALSVAAMFAIFSDFGLSRIVTREFAKDGEKKEEFYSILSLKLILSLGALLLMFVGSFIATPDLAIRKIIWILSFYIIFDSFSIIIFSFFNVRQQMQYEALTKILEAFLVTSMGFFIMITSPSVKGLSYAYLLGSFGGMCLIIFFFNSKVFHFKLSFDKHIWKRFLGLSWPLGLAALSSTIYGNIDSVMLGFLGEIRENGWYNAAYKLINVTLIPTALIAQAFYPALVVALKESKARLQRIWHAQLEIMIVFALPLVVGAIALAPKIIDLVYDPGFSPSIFVFQILALMAGLFFLCSPFHHILIVLNEQKKFLFVVLAAAVANMLLNIILIPMASLYGAAIARTLTQVLMFILLLRFAKKIFPINIWSKRLSLTFMAAVFSSAVMYALISNPIVYNLHVVFSALIGAAVYFLCFFVYKKIKNKVSKDEQ